jgi:Ca2+-transporting ATPase
LPALVAFHEVIIDPACSIVFEVEEPDPKIMEQPPRQRKQPLFNMIGIRDAFLQGATVLVGVLGTYLFAIYQGYTAELIRSLTFATLLIANLILIMVNRSKTLTIWESAFRRRNRALPWILLFGLSILLSLLNVPILRDSFGLASLSARELLLVIVVSYLSVCWSDIVKLLRSNRTVH